MNIPKWLEEFGPFETGFEELITKKTYLFNDIATKILLIVPGSLYQAETVLVFENIRSSSGHALLINRHGELIICLDELPDADTRMA